MRIIVLSRQSELYSTRRLREAAHQHRHQVAVIDPLTRLVMLNGNPPRTLPPDNCALIPRIGASITEFGCALVRQYQHEGIWTINSASGIIQSRDKMQSMQLLQGHGLPVPRTAIVGQVSGLERAIHQVGGLPAVLKLRRGTQGKGVVLVRSMAAARRVFDLLNEFQHVVLVQEFIAEAHCRDIRVIVVGDQPIAAMERRAAPGDFRANLHRGGSAQRLPLAEPIASLAVKAAQAHKLGFAGVDLIMTGKGPAVIELNSSPGLEGIETTTNVDVAGAVMDFIEDQAREHRRQE